MATKSDIKQALLDWLVPIIETETAVSNGYPHCGLLNQRDESVYPYVGFEMYGDPLTNGIGGDLYVDDVQYENDLIIYRRDTTLTVEIGVVDEAATTVDDLYTAIGDEFDRLIDFEDGYGSLHADVRDVSFEGFRKPTTDDDVHSDRLIYEIRYGRHLTRDVPVLDAVNVDIEVYEGNSTTEVPDA